MKRSALIRFYLRERAARISMVYDFLTNRTPHHMGKPVKLPH
jgi:vancomycin permeability regulator SanA